MWREISAEYKNLTFRHFKIICAIIGYRSTKYFVSFAKVPVKLRILKINRILFYVLNWSVYLINIGELFSLFSCFMRFLCFLLSCELHGVSTR